MTPLNTLKSLFKRGGSGLSKEMFLLFKTPIIVGISMALVLVVGVNFFVQPKKSRYEALENRYVKMQQRIRDIQRKTKQQKPISDYHSKLLLSVQDESQDYVNYINKRFIIDPYQKDISYVTINFKHNVRILSKERKLVGGDFYIKSQLNVNLLGTFNGITRYLQTIHRLPVLFNYEKIYIVKSNQGAHPIQLDLALNFYFLNENF